MSSIKLIATDLDGTMLNSEGKMSNRTREVFAAVKEKGVYFTLATGRMFSSASRFAAEIGVEIPLICYNGAMVRRPSGELLSHTPLEMGLARRMLAYFKENNIYVQSYVNDELHVRDEDEEEFRMYIRHFGVVGYAVGDSVYTPEDAPTKLLAVKETEEEASALMLELRRLFGEEAYITRSNAEFVEMMSPSVGKGRALEELAASLGVSMGDVLAIGDGENDAGMIELAGYGLAMSNARERAKTMAKEIVPSNDEDGLAWALEKYVLSV